MKSAPASAVVAPAPFSPHPRPLTRTLRLLFPPLLAAVALVALFRHPPFAQDQTYFDFADRRPRAGLPNAADVVSNLPFLLVGIAGLARLPRSRSPGRVGWRVFFGGVTLVAFGSTWFHLAPCDATLVWDRLPMTVGFTGLLLALAGETVAPRAARVVLAPALLVAGATVPYWRWLGDLRPYFAVQIVTLGGAVWLAVSDALPRRARFWLLGGLLCYGLAIAAEQLDHAIYSATAHLFSGHTLKHLLAAAGCAAMLGLDASAPEKSGRSLRSPVRRC